jgi:anti-sigma factor RsiW
MRPDETRSNEPGPCPEFEPRLVLYAADELERSERDAISKHIEECAGCAAALHRERHLLEFVSATGVQEPDANLLAKCRDGFNEALDEILEQPPSFVARWADRLFPGSWFALHPVWSAVLFVLIGFSVGSIAPRLLQYRTPLPGSPPVPETAPPIASVAPVAASLDDQTLRTADVAGINWTAAADNEAPRIEVQLSAERPVVVQGTVNSGDVRRVLLYILRHNERFCPDVRLDAVELLRSKTNDPDVRQALCGAVHADQNPAVRLKALEALNGAEPQDIIRQTLMDALTQDSNPGVRIEAINSLRTFTERGVVGSDERLVAVLRERARMDPNAYIRLQSASAIRDLGPREKY